MASRVREAAELLSGWAVGLPFAMWRYADRRLPVRRETNACAWPIEGFPGDKLEYDVLTDDLQRPDSGYGPAFRRRYSVLIERPILTAEQLIAVIAANPNVASPTEMARFERTRGECGRLEPGDEFLIRLPGLWNGPVRTVHVTARSFRFATLEGHMEAGEIEFRALPEEDGAIRFEIESWARSGDRLFHLLYHRARLTMEIQLHMWAHFLERVAHIAGGRPAGSIDCLTDRCDDYPVAA